MATENDLNTGTTPTQGLRRTRRKQVLHLAPKLAERDGGWFCHYCGIGLIPPGVAEGTAPYYKLVLQQVAHPATTGDCGGRYTVAEVYEAIWLASHGLLKHWHVVWDHPGYSFPVVDHVVPLAKGGANHLDNLVLACHPCNAKKATKSYATFRSEMSGGEK